jgi:hypothetical protein
MRYIVRRENRGPLAGSSPDPDCEAVFGVGVNARLADDESLAVRCGPGAEPSPTMFDILIILVTM